MMESFILCAENTIGSRSFLIQASWVWGFVHGINLSVVKWCWVLSSRHAGG